MRNAKIVTEKAKKTVNTALRGLGFEVIQQGDSAGACFNGTSKELAENVLPALFITIDNLYRAMITVTASVVDDDKDLMAVKRTYEKMVTTLNITTHQLLNKIADNGGYTSDVIQKEYEQWKKDNAI